MTKEQIIQAIGSFNRTASYEFLSQFSEEELCEYLNQLTSALSRKGGTPVSQRATSHSEPVVGVA